MSLETWLAFAAASAVLLVIPGPTILTVISYSVAHGGRANAPLVAAGSTGTSLSAGAGFGRTRMTAACSSWMADDTPGGT